MPRTVAEVMTVPALTAAGEEPLAVAARRMADASIGSVVVVEGNRPVGILTERDLLTAAANDADPRTALVADWMTRDPECLEADATIDDAWRRLGERGYRHIPVVAGGEFKGIVSMRDLVALAQLRPAGESAMVAPPGLKGVVVAETALGDVRGSEGFFHYRQYAAPDLAAVCSFEDVWHLMIDGALPSVDDRAAFAAEVAPLRALPHAAARRAPRDRAGRRADGGPAHRAVSSRGRRRPRTLAPRRPVDVARYGARNYRRCADDRRRHPPAAYRPRARRAP